MSLLTRRPVSFAVVLSVVMSSLAVLIPSMTKVVEAAPRTKVKYEVCHRTNAIKNPYRRISVAKSAVDDNGNGHDNSTHDGPVFDITNNAARHANTPRDSGLGGEAGGGNDRWGDIFYAQWGPSQNQRNSNNWTTAGQAIFENDPVVINPRSGKAVCRSMSVKEFIESEREENPNISMQSIMNELDEMEAAEDLPLKTVLGGSFGTWFGSCTVNCEDISVITSAIEEKLPRVTTEPPSNVAGTTATLNGTVSPLGTTMQWYFEWVPTTPNFADTNNAINVTPLVNANASTTSSPPQPVTANITGLTSGTTYYYRTVGLATSGSNDTLVESYTYGVVKQFNVNAPGSPTITGITCGSTTLSVAFTAPTVNAGGITAYEYSLDGGTTFTAASSASSPISITSLTNGTQYSVAIRAKAGSVNGLDSTVTNAIPCGTPVAVTDPATLVSQQTATLNGNLTANGNPLTVTFVWGTDSSLTTGTTTTAAVPGSLAATADEYPVTLNLTGLTGQTTYYFKVVGTPTSGSAVEGIIRQFTTTAAPLPAVTTNPATSVTGTTATLNGTGTSNGASSTVTFTWGTDSTLTTGNNTATASQSPLASGASGASVSAALTGLTPGTTYYFRATISNANSNGNINGIIRQFTTDAPPAPTVTTEPATSVTGTTATLNGTGTSNGASSTVTFTWGTDSTLTTGNNTATASQSPLASGASGASVSAALTGLTPGTTYYFRATISNANSNGNINGIIRQFTTDAPPAPTVTTEPATSVTGTTATINGTGTSNGASSTVTFTWGTDSTLTTGNNTATASQSPLASGASGASVSAALTGLTPGTTYYFRATISNANSNGNINGIIRQFTTETPQASSVAPTTTAPASTPSNVVSAATGTVEGITWIDADRDERKDSSEAWLPGISISLTLRSDSSQTTSQATDANGAYSFTGITPGSYTLRAVLPQDLGLERSWDSSGNTDWVVVVTVESNATARANFAAVGSAIATGTVSGGGGGEVLAVWSGVDQQPGTNDDTTFTADISESEEFVVSGLPLGRYTLTARSRTGRGLVSAASLRVTSSGATSNSGALKMDVRIVKALPQTGATGLSLPLGFAVMLIPMGIASTGLARRRRR